MTRATKRGLLVITAELVVFLVAHALLLRWFSGGEVATVLFTGGQDVSAATLVGAGVFFAVRLALHLVLPGLILAQLAGLCLGFGAAPATPQPGSSGGAGRRGKSRP